MRRANDDFEMKNKKIIAIWARTLTQILSGQTEAERKTSLEKVYAVLAQKKKDYLLPKILEMVQSGFKKRGQLQLSFARAQDADTLEKIKLQLADLGKKREIVVALDEEIIGGFVAKTEDYIVNASIKDYLEQLRRQYAA